MCVLYVYTTDLDFCDPVFGFKSVSNHINPFSIVTYFLKNEYYIFWILQIGTLLRTFLECERRPYHFIASIFCSLCVDLTSNDFQFLFFPSCCFLFCFQKPSPVRQGVRYMFKYQILVHFKEKSRHKNSSKISFHQVRLSSQSK